jgi:hypothetical protein
MCDTGAIANTGESKSCPSAYDEDTLMRLMKDLIDGGGFDFGLLLNFGAAAGNDLLVGIIAHITNYFSFFAYPAIWPLTVSTQC